MENNNDANAKLEYLYFIETIKHFDKKDELNACIKEDVLYKVPIVKETKQSYYVPRHRCYKTVDEYKKRFKDTDDIKNCFLVNKQTMQAKISDYGSTHRFYYQHPFLAKESHFISKNSVRIADALRQCKNPFLLRQVAHNLELEDLEELTYDFEIKGEEE